MHKIVRFFRNFVFIPIGIGILIVILYILNQKVLAIWLAHIWMVIYFMPIVYELTGSFNLAFCCNPALKCERNSGFRKKVILNPFWKNLFCGYDIDGNMLWLMLSYQCLFLAYICVFILLNVMFIITLVAANTISTSWIRLWILEIVAQLVIFAIAMISSYLKDIYLWSKKRKKAKHSNISSDNMIKKDLKILKQKKIIKQKNEIVTFLKQYGLRVDKHKHFMIYSTDAKQIEKVLSKEFPELYVSVLENQKGTRLLTIYNTKKEYLLIQIEISNV